MSNPPVYTGGFPRLFLLGRQQLAKLLASELTSEERHAKQTAAEQEHGNRLRSGAGRDVVVHNSYLS